uniref:Pre-mRNA 3' end processing protein WDR33 n=1 Tax=Panagrolaimus sp. JU765 TaxID=591449 RepID=A0AC34RQT3_9BILA
MMTELFTYKGHRKEVTALAWHPIHENLFVSGGGDGSVGYWLADPFTELGLYEGAHDQTIWDMSWHPLGHILATGSNDNNTKFWGRNRPGDTLEDLSGMIGTLKETHHQPVTNFNYYNYQVKYAEEDVEKKIPLLPGLGLDSNMREITTLPESIPGLPVVPDDYATRNVSGTGRKTLIKQPPPKKAQQQFEKTWVKSSTDDMNGGMNYDDGNTNPNYIPLPLQHFQQTNGTTMPSLLGNRPLLPQPRMPIIAPLLSQPLLQPIQPLLASTISSTEGESWRSTSNDTNVTNDVWRNPFTTQFSTFNNQQPFIQTNNQMPGSFFNFDGLPQTNNSMLSPTIPNDQGDSWKTDSSETRQQQMQPLVTTHGLPQLDPRKRRSNADQNG